MAEAPPSEPPSLSEPLLRLKTVSLQGALTCLHGVVSSLAMGLQAERDRREMDTQELRAESRTLLDRVHALEALFYSRASPNAESSTSNAETNSTAEASLSLAHLAEQTRMLEESLGSFKEKNVNHQSAQDSLVAMRFEAVELELSGCLRPKLLEAQRQEIEEWRGRLEKDLAESVTQLGLELKAGLATKFDATRQSLEKVKDSIAGRVQVCEELLGTGPESTMSTMSDAAAAPKPSGGSGGAGGASIEVRVARIEANMKKAASKPSSAGGGTDIMVTAAVSRGNSGHLLGVEEAQRLAEEAAERCSVLEVRLEQVSNQVQDLKKSPPSAGVKVVASEARSRSKTSSAEIAMHAEIAASEANAAPAQRPQVLSRDLPTSEAQEAFVMEPPGATSFAAEGLPPDFAEALEARFASLERRLDSPDRAFAELESIVEAEADADVQMEAAPDDAAEAEADAAPKGKSPGLDKLQKDLDKLSKEVKGRLSNLDKNVKKLQGDKPAAPAAAGAQSVVAEVIRVQESFREVSGDAAAAGLALAESYASELLEHGAELQRLSEKVTGLHDAVATLSNQSRTPEVEALPTAAAVAAAEVPAAEAEVPAAAAPSAPSG
eukprot:CAMPEP_0115145112 /NCGR_PEP_ID=MMETSP0227-20121206/61925_1 /TAXON_ID=89957 /ORGANISM="Polarella glacialis, Strain CCMP 1383" /LENGTH=607 /DNA_ID=CAMNT_0002554575 /DNA_START=61 /DNA_END=1881 /DNA_ORIENTATION=+